MQLECQDPFRGSFTFLMVLDFRHQDTIDEVLADVSFCNNAIGIPLSEIELGRECSRIAARTDLRFLSRRIDRNDLTSLS